MSWKYRIFNLVVASDIPVDEACPAYQDESVDVTVRLGEMSVNPYTHPGTVYTGPENEIWYCMPEKNHFLFRSAAGEYEIRNGSDITVNPDSGSGPSLVNTFLLGTAFGTLQIQRGLFPIHGGSIELGGKGLILTGKTGAGKSTLTGGFVLRGRRYLADDVSTVTFESGEAEINPAYPQRKLCRDACISQGHIPESLVKLDGEGDKFAVRRVEEWLDNRVPLEWMVEIALDDSGEARLQRVEGHEKLRMLLSNLYRPQIYFKRGIDPPDMKRLLKITSETKMYRLFRPTGNKSVEPLLDMLMDGLSGRDGA